MKTAIILVEIRRSGALRCSSWSCGFFSVTGVRNAPVSVWPLAAGLLLVIGWSGLWLGRELFPGWSGRGGD
jgi:hypothetical protein